MDIRAINGISASLMLRRIGFIQITQDHILENRRSKMRTIFNLLLIKIYLISLTGCGYTALTKHFIPEYPGRTRIHEWHFSISLAAFFREDKKNFVKHYNRLPEEYKDYDLYLTFWTITEIDTTLSKEERHKVRIDSVKISFEDFTKTFLLNNVFEDNVRRKKFGNVPLSYLYARTEISVGSLCIPPGTQKVNVNVYGMFRSIRDGLEPFELSTWLRYEEKSEKISKYD